MANWKKQLAKPSRLAVFPDNALRRTCVEVEPGGEDVIGLASLMQRVMYTNQAHGIAAPQLGHAVRMFAVDVPEYSGVIVNPVVLVEPGKQPYKPYSVSAEVADWAEEGCLSFPGWTQRVPRYPCVHLSGVSERGDKLAYVLYGPSARVVQHEFDHLEGALIVDYGSEACKLQATKKVKRTLRQVRRD